MFSKSGSVGERPGRRNAPATSAHSSSAITSTLARSRLDRRLLYASLIVRRPNDGPTSSTTQPGTCRHRSGPDAIDLGAAFGGESTTTRFTWSAERCCWRRLTNARAATGSVRRCSISDDGLCHSKRSPSDRSNPPDRLAGRRSKRSFPGRKRHRSPRSSPDRINSAAVTSLRAPMSQT